MVVEGLTCKTPSGETLRVREVWQANLEDEFDLIRDIVDEYPFVAMDTEFPGVVARPVGNFKNSGEYHFQTLRYAQAAFIVAAGCCQACQSVSSSCARSAQWLYIQSCLIRWLVSFTVQVQCRHAETHTAGTHIHQC